MGHNPLGYVFIELWVKDGLLQSGKRSICVHQTALHEHVTVALEVIAGRAGWKGGHLLIEETSQALGPCAAARVRIHLVHAAHVAQLGFILAILAGAGTCLESILFTDGPRAAPIEADLSLSVAGGEVGFGLGCGALSADSITHALVSTLRLLSALVVTTLV